MPRNETHLTTAVDWAMVMVWACLEAMADIFFVDVGGGGARVCCERREEQGDLAGTLKLNLNWI